MFEIFCSLYLITKSVKEAGKIPMQLLLQGTEVR